MRVVAYSDGSSRGNPGPGGFGTVLLYTDPAGQTHKRELSQGYRRTTNNRMELMGAIAALEALNIVRRIAVRRSLGGPVQRLLDFIEPQQERMGEW